MASIDIDLRAWRQFVVLAEELHFGRAAERLHMTQPPLTQAIAQLERRLGVRLFERTSRKVALTAVARQLLPQVQALLLQAERLPAMAQAMQQGTLGQLRLGFVSTAGYDLIPHWVRLLRAHYPGVRLLLQEATGDQQLRALRKGELDAGLMLHVPGSLPQDLQAVPVRMETLRLAIPSRHALAAGDAAEPVAVSQLAGQWLVSTPRHILPSLHDALVRLYRQHGMAFDVVQEAIQMQTLVNLVSAGLGLAWVPQSVQAFQREGVVYRRVAAQHGTLPSLECSLVWSDAAPLQPALEPVVQWLGEHPLE
ncbi:LysR family transcriptional regulator [Lampropedia cohaerens]|uniref:LysR family transcriptional regulator n=1 Tax=Lampropedia cohaerens TaxID=1610491 RepID=A0A0U1PX58_9BURK|nr:LysR family transcriptional regulator [Lampropedia cohaerens]KKW67118.1 LysR family transcriptional regulator [Lampropedia cohaerens]